MAGCNESDWEITLKLDKGADTEDISFKNIAITNGSLFGRVDDDPGEFMSALRGRCTPSEITGLPDMSHLEFVFNVVDKNGKVFVLYLKGIGYLPPAGTKKEFRGEFRAYLPYTGGPFSFSEELLQLAAPSGQLDKLVFDEGDTGTGTGQQT